MTANDQKINNLNGCEICSKTPEPNFDTNDLPFQETKRLYSSSHSDFLLCECTFCKQPYLYQFHEIVYWSGNVGDDIWLRWMPLLSSEVHEIDKLFSGRENRSGYWDKLASIIRRRDRLVRHPDGHFFRSDSDAGDMMPPA